MSPLLDQAQVKAGYLRTQQLPTTWCPGCGLGIILGAICRALALVGWAKDQVAVVSGIGCSGRLSTYLDVSTIHATHGRALPLATGLKLARPELNVLVVMGDGDALSIGTSHFIHAARRNLGLKALVLNNATYGLTGGQTAPTTPQGKRTTTARYGPPDQPLDMAALARAAGAAFVGRTTVHHVWEMIGLLQAAFCTEGFAAVEVLFNCHVHYGRLNQLGAPFDLIAHLWGTTARASPALLRRFQWPVRLRQEADGAVISEPLEGGQGLPRGILLSRSGARPEYGQRRTW